MLTVNSYSPTVVWVLLLGATGLAALVGSADSPMTSLLLVITTLKVALVMTFFMELGFSPRRWRLAFAIWLAAVTTMLILSFELV